MTLPLKISLNCQGINTCTYCIKPSNLKYVCISVLVCRTITQLFTCICLSIQFITEPMTVKKLQAIALGLLCSLLAVS